MNLLPGLLLVVVGLLVLLGWRGIASFFTHLQQQDRLYAHPNAGFYQRLNTLLFGAALLVMVLLAIFR